MLFRSEAIAIENAGSARTVDEVVGQYLAPQRFDLRRLREEPMAADIEQIAIVLLSAAEAAHEAGVLLQDRDPARRLLLRQQIPRGQAGWSCPDDKNVQNIFGCQDRKPPKVEGGASVEGPSEAVKSVMPSALAGQAIEAIELGGCEPGAIVDQKPVAQDHERFARDALPDHGRSDEARHSPAWQGADIVSQR